MGFEGLSMLEPSMSLENKNNLSIQVFQRSQKVLYVEVVFIKLTVFYSM